MSTNPHHLGGDDPNRPRHQPSHPHTPISPLQSILPVFSQSQAGQHHYGFVDTSGSTTTGPSSTTNSPRPIHGYAQVPPVESRRQQLGLTIPEPATPSFTFHYPSASTPQHPHNQLHSPFYSTAGFDAAAGPSSLSQGHDPTAFRSFHHTVDNGGVYLLQSQDWSTQPVPAVGPSANKTAGASSKGSGGKRSAAGSATGGGGKNARTQFTACGACRHRRVRCDLRAKQDAAEREAQAEGSRSGTSAASIRRRKVSCTNCQERGTNCVDEYAPLKAAKQLRRGKRISEIEMLYGKSATDMALASQGEDGDPSTSPTARKFERIPELTREFFDSDFFHRFHTQRPIVDKLEFVTRYLSKPIPCSAAMGREGSALCHCLYAWAVSYGVDERGQPEATEADPLSATSLVPSENENKRQTERQHRKEKTYHVVRTILREIDDYGIMRKPSWDGVRVLLLVLPLTEGLAPSLERQNLYHTALSQVSMLCSCPGVGYDGQPVTLPNTSVAGDLERQEILRMRIHWFAYVNEGMLSGLRGNNLLLQDDEDLAIIQEAAERLPLVNLPGHQAPAKMGMTPISIARACRYIHTALTGKEGRRLESFNVALIQEARDLLDKCWDDLESIKLEAPSEPFRHKDEVVFFADSWKISMFEAYTTILKGLEDRHDRLLAAGGAHTPASRSSSSSPGHMVDYSPQTNIVRQLIDMASSKNTALAHHILDIARSHLNTRFFEWDAAYVPDGTFYAALQLLRDHINQDQDVNVCLQALNEGQWAFGKGQERINDVRHKTLHSSEDRRTHWGTQRSVDPISAGAEHMPPLSTTDLDPDLPKSATPWPASATLPATARFSPTHVPPDMSPLSTGPFAMFQQSHHPAAHVAHHHHHRDPLGGPGAGPGQGAQGGPGMGMPSHHSHSPSSQPGSVGYPQGQWVLHPDNTQVFVPYPGSLPISQGPLGSPREHANIHQV